MSTKSNDTKTDLSDMTFLVPLRIESNERKENIDTLIKYTFLHFNTSLIVLEADRSRKYYPVCETNEIKYEFIQDNDEVFHRTKWLNNLISFADTKYVGIWDVDAIAPSTQILNAVEALRSDKYAMSFPYDGRFYSCDKISSRVFKDILDIETLVNRLQIMRLMHGYHSVGGAFIVKRDQYLDAGGENENFYGWGPEDTERVKRMEILNLPIYYSPGTLFHLWHRVGKNSWFASLEVEKNNRLELLKVCKREL